MATEDSDGFVCDESGVFIGEAACGDKRFRALEDVTEASTEVCAVRKFRMRYGETLKDADGILRFRVSGLQADRKQWTFGIRYALDMLLSNGTGVPFEYRTIRFEKYARTRAAGFSHFTGERAG